MIIRGGIFYLLYVGRCLVSRRAQRPREIGLNSRVAEGELLQNMLCIAIGKTRFVQLPAALSGPVSLGRIRALRELCSAVLACAVFYLKLTALIGV